MKLQRFESSFLAVCLLICTGLAQECEWDQSTDPNQGLDQDFMNAGSIHLLNITEVPDSESCRAACCNEPDCDLALVGYPQDGGPQCMLMRCLIQGRDVCVLQSSSQFSAYRKAVKTETPKEEEKGGQVPHIVPLLGSWEPKTNETNNIRCRLPMKVGSCRAAFPKFYYDVTNQTCRKFIYGGCSSNGNNFDSQEECEATCSGVTGSVLPDESTAAPPPIKAARMAPAFKRIESEIPATETVVTVPPVEKEMSAEDFAELCQVKPDVGPCKAMFIRWYYNRETGSCQSFTYGGCKGNKNNYDSEESCKAACTVTVLPSSKKAAADDDDDEVSAEHKDHCMVTPDPGPCRAAFPMFYYDPKTGSCESFMYGGCRGNQNRYTSVKDCMNRCATTSCFFGHGTARNRWTAGIFLFLTLAAISALLLATLIIITIKRRNLSRRPPSISDKEELLPDEQSSVESLTLPESPKPNKA